MEVLQENNIFNNKKLFTKITEEKDFLFNNGLVDEDILDIPQSVLFILKGEKEIIGFMTYCHYNNVMWLIFCWVSPSCRAENLASIMLNELKRITKTYNSNCKIRTMTHVNNITTQTVLIKRNFKPLHYTYEL